jgi:hypothetical protein
MGIDSLTQKIGQARCQAKDLLDKHKQMYRKFWKWSDAAVDYGMLHSKLWTAYGWTVHVGENPNPRFLRNFLMQGNGAEMLRLACCFLTLSGIRVCAPIHDAVLIEAPLKELDDTICEAQALMAQASRVVLSGFELRTDVDVIRHPDRYKDARGTKMWETVQGILHELDDTPEPVS